MLLLHEAIQDKQFDSRIVEKNVSRGVTAQKDYQKYLEGLEDVSRDALWVSVDDLAREIRESSEA